MDRVLHFVLAIVVVAILALLVSHDRKKIRIRYVVQLLVIEVLLAWFFLNSDIGLGFVKGFSEMFEKLLGFANEGTNFVFGSMNDKGLAFFFLKVLCPIVFISALIGILQHIRILPIVIRAIGTVLSKINGMGKLESFNAVSSLILGQSENFIAYKDILGKMSRNRMYTMAATAMSTVSMSIVGAYMTMLQPKYVVAALVLNMFSTFIVLSLINPYRVEESEENLQMSNLHEGQSFFEMLGEYILAGFKVAIIVAAMLIGFIALISALNALFRHRDRLVRLQHLLPGDPRLYLLPGCLGDGCAGKRSAAGGQYYGHQAGLQRIRRHDGSAENRLDALSACGRHYLYLPGLLRQLLIYRHHRRGDQRLERRTG